MLKGKGELISKSEKLTVNAGEIFFIPKNSTYKSLWIPDNECTFHTIHCNFSVLDDPFYEKKVELQKLDNTEFPFFYSLVEKMTANQTENERVNFSYLSAFYTLLENLLPKIKVLDVAVKAKQISPALIYLENNYTEQVKVEDLASMCFLSPSRFFYLFKEQTGCSPISYKNKIAIQHATKTLLLEKEKSIENIALEYGFDTSIYFRRLFKQLTGKTPTEYRKEVTLI
jgi:AraC-like DNA-binding protein